jgi:hypothetical protein
MPIERARLALGQVLFQRCFYLFVGVLALITAGLMVEPSVQGRIILSAVNVLLDVTAVAAVGRSRLSFTLAVMLAAPAMFFQVRGITSGDATHVMIARGFACALYAVTIGYLLRYVFQRDVMTADKLYGATAGYLMIGVLWAFFFAIANDLEPGSFVSGGTVLSPSLPDLMYFSFTTLTSTGFGDIVPALRVARGLTVLEQLTGGLFVAVLIARLAGVYPPGRERR